MRRGQASGGSSAIVKTLFLSRLHRSKQDPPGLCVVLGAGADIASGGMTFRQLKRSCIERFTATPALSIMTDDAVDEVFDRLLEENNTGPQRAAIIDYVVHGSLSAQPSDGYKLLILLAKEGIVDSIVTTNFDNLLEIAQREMKLDVFQVYAPGVASPFIVDGQLYLPSRPIYVKLHGDVRAHLVTHITRREIESREYEGAFSLLLRHILGHQQLLFVGYRGGDRILAEEIERIAGRLVSPVVWCDVSQPNPESPVLRALRNVTVRSVRASFEEIFTEAGAGCLSSASPLDASIHFLEPLISERLRQVNEQFLRGFHYQAHHDRLALLVPRKSIMEQLARFRTNSDKPLTVVVGSSGVGKSTVLAQLCDVAADQDFVSFVAIRALSIGTDFARAVVERLGYASANSLALLYHFSAWLSDRQQQLTIAVDGLNEISFTTTERVVLFREILRAALWLEFHGSIKIMVTIRPEAWQEIYSFIDSIDLGRVLWTDKEFPDTIAAVSLQAFNSAELNAAYRAYAAYYSVATPLREVDLGSRELLRDPYYLALAMQSREVITADSLDSELQQQIHYNLLRTTFGAAHARSIAISLARLAALGLESECTQFSLADVASANLSLEDAGTLCEIKMLDQANGSTYRFSHDRVHDAYLVVAIRDLAAIPLLSRSDLVEALQRALKYPRVGPALRQCFAHPAAGIAQHHTRLLFEILEEAHSPSSSYDLGTRALLSEFAKDVLLMIATGAPERFAALMEAYLTAVASEPQITVARLLLHTSSVLAPERCLPLILLAAKSIDTVLGGEAGILLYDKCAQHILGGPGAAQRAFQADSLRAFFLGDDTGLAVSIFRLCGLVAHVGADNTSAPEWREVSGVVKRLLREACAQKEERRESKAELADMVVAHANRYLFNAQEDILEHYFMSASRRRLLLVLKQLELRQPLTVAQVQQLRPYVSELGHTMEFIICNLFFIMSMQIDSRRTLEVFDDYFKLLDGSVPEEVDFFLSALCLSHAALGLPFQDIMAHYTDAILREYPQAFLGNPGVVRGKKRGKFTDPFDQQFEDGFNPLAFYFYNAPSGQRQEVEYRKYLETTPHDDLIPLYWKFLGQFEAQSNVIGTLRVVHAIGQMISLWPREGLHALRRLVGRTDPTVRRAITRVLAEAYVRFPLETMLMITESGSAFTEAERRAIKYGLDPRLAERSFEQLHWGRLLFFLGDLDPLFIQEMTKILVRSISLPEALESLIARIQKLATAAD